MRVKLIQGQLEAMLYPARMEVEGGNWFACDFDLIFTDAFIEQFVDEAGEFDLEGASGLVIDALRSNFQWDRSGDAEEVRKRLNAIPTVQRLLEDWGDDVAPGTCADFTCNLNDDLFQTLRRRYLEYAERHPLP